MTENHKPLMVPMTLALEETYPAYFSNDTKALIDSLVAVMSTDISWTVEEVVSWTNNAGQRPNFPEHVWFEMVTTMKEFYNPTSLQSAIFEAEAEANLLTVDTDDETLPETLRKLATLAQVGASTGSPVGDLEDLFEWIDEDMANHVQPKGSCPLYSISNVKKDAWTQLSTTDFDATGDRNGYQADAECVCGQWGGRFRWEV